MAWDADAPVYGWKREGRLLLWHYPTAGGGWAGWHLSGDAAACASVVALIDALLMAVRLRDKRIPVDEPRAMLVAPDLAWESAAVLLLRHAPDDADDRLWRITSDKRAREVTLTVGTARLRELRQALLDLPKWRDDYALGPDPAADGRGGRGAPWAGAGQRLWLWTRAE